MRYLANTIGYLAYVAALLFVIRGGYGAWMIVAVACVLIVAWFAFAYAAGGDERDDG